MVIDHPREGDTVFDVFAARARQRSSRSLLEQAIACRDRYELRFAVNYLDVELLLLLPLRLPRRQSAVEEHVCRQTLRRRLLMLPGRLTRSARRRRLHLPTDWPWATQFLRALVRLQAIPRHS